MRLDRLGSDGGTGSIFLPLSCGDDEADGRSSLRLHRAAGASSGTQWRASTSLCVKFPLRGAEIEGDDREISVEPLKACGERKRLPFPGVAGRGDF